MVSLQQDYSRVFLNIKNDDRFVSIHTIPPISAETQKILERLGNQSVQAFKSAPLKERATQLAETVKKFHAARKKDTKLNKFLAILQTSFTVAIAVGGLFGTLAALAAGCPPVAIGVALGASLVYCLLCVCNAHDYDIKIRPRLKDIVKVFLLGPFFTLYEAFGKADRIKQTMLAQKESLEANFTELTDFFNSKHAQIKEKLLQEMENLETSLKSLEKLPFQTLAIKIELYRQRDHYRTALSELDEAKTFFSKYR
ncbi:hypothetical protein [Parachlamydia sp. AcF125]|uniref:hypothetical protein n=1 Tax=Parachlamydia sp. AcF125 TaxID=2795736 RepID=UPI001BC91BD7|nr:hypothetical protein [Parachlamydia sp. AcF125]MBS4169171.1 hypothetical protein [Parachlamydia sp. AcF125]